MLQPTRLISTPFAQEGDKTEIQNVTGEFDNSATYRLGFPPLTMQSIRLGGKPPEGTDFNGVLFDITENISFLCKGGRYQYNSGLSTLIGGYPEGSNLLLDDNVTEVVSTVAGNQNDPNSDMTGWTFKPNRTTAEYVLDASGETQQQVNYNGGSKWHSRVGGYLENERVVLTNGDIVKSTIDGNVNDPNVDMTGWIGATDAAFVVDGDKTQKQINAGQLSFNAALAAVAMISESNTWQQNRDIIQAVNDALYLQKGGGKIQLPSGDFVLKGVLLDSNVKIQGNNTNIHHPDNYNVNIFETRTYSTTGSCAKDSFTITVTDSSKFKVGSLIAIQGAGGISKFQNSTLVNAISSADTNIVLASATGFSAGYLVVDDEIISYASISSDGTLNGVQRAQFGTIATQHNVGTQIGIAMRHISEIIAINGNTITILDAIKTTVSNANVLCGGQGCRVDGVNFYGERQLDVAGWRWSPFRMRLHRFGGLNYYAENCENGFNLELSCDNDINFFGKDLAKATYGGIVVGASGWLFQQCHRNSVNAKIVGDCGAGIYLDNRTSSGTEYDGGCDGNSGSLTFKYSNYNPLHTTTGFLTVGGSNNDFTIFSEGVRTAAVLGASDQTYNSDGFTPKCVGNILNVRVKQGYYSVICDRGAIGNTFILSQESVVMQPIINEGNMVLSSNEAGSVGNYLRFRDGTSARPGLSFRGDATQGFWRSPAGDLRLYKNNLEQLRFTDVGLHFPDGKVISTGSGAGLKIGGATAQPLGFYGVTPIVQPSIGGAASDATTTQTLANNIRAALINLGLAKT